MRILVIGATGFIGSYITAKLLKDKQIAICGVKNVDLAQRKFPNTEIITCDFNTDTTPEKWYDKLQNIDVVINVAGLLVSCGKNKIENVHINGPKALFEACVYSKVKRIIHISALGIDNENTTPYALTKKTADTYLQTLENIDWVILQPSLIYANGCYGGTSLLRGLASLPYIIPLIGDGLQKFQPIYMEDFTDIVLYLAKKEGKICRLLKIVGPEIVSIKDILIHFRNWLGLSPAKLIKIPSWFINLLAKLGDFLGLQPLNTTSYKMLNTVSFADKNEIISLTGITPRDLQQVLTSEPLTIQSLWHARLFLLKPILKLTLGLFWIITGLISSIIAPETALSFIMELGFHKQSAQIMLYSSCLLDIFLGLMLIIKNKSSKIYIFQILLIIVYTLILSILKPNLWLEPLGSLTKNIPIIFLISLLLAIERDK